MSRSDRDAWGLVVTVSLVVVLSGAAGAPRPEGVRVPEGTAVHRDLAYVSDGRPR